MKVLRHAKDQCLILWDAFHFIPPFSCNLHSSFYSLSTSIHRKYHVETKELCDEFSKSREHIIVKGPRTQGESRCLFGQGFDELGVAVALIDRTVCTEEVEIAFPWTW